MLYIEAFYELSSCRPMGLAPGPIPWKDMIAYAEYAGVDRELWRDFVAILRTLDNAYLKWSSQQNSSGGKDSGKGQGVPQGPHGRRRSRWLSSSG